MSNATKTFEEVASSLEALHLTDIQNPEHPSYAFQTREYSLLIMRFFELGEDGLQGVSTPYLIKRGEIYRYDRELHSFTQLRNYGDILSSIETQLLQSESIVKRYISFFILLLIKYN